VPPGSTTVIGSVIPTITCLIPIEQSSGGKLRVELKTKTGISMELT